MQEKKSVRVEVVSWIFRPWKIYLEVSPSPLAWTCDEVYESMERSHAGFPSWLSSPQDCKCVYVNENIES